MNKRFYKIFVILLSVSIASSSFFIMSSEKVEAGSYDGGDLALAILANSSTLVSSSYWDRDTYGHRQAIVLSSLGTMQPTDGNTFIILSTGIAGTPIVTTNAQNPGEERGTWFKNKYGYPRDQAVLTLVLRVPEGMHYLCYDFQFFSAEYPEYVGSQYNDKFEVTVNSPSCGVSKYVCDVNSGNFVLNSRYIPGTGFDIFAQSGNPKDVDWVDNIPRNPGADAGATALVTVSHPVAPFEEVTVTFSVRDVGDNQFDTAVFLDNLVFSGYAKPNIIGRKYVKDLNNEPYEPNDEIEYTITISNTGGANQRNNPGNEFEDPIPQGLQYVPNSATATSGTVAYDGLQNKIIWNGQIPAQSTVVITYRATINSNLTNGTKISNQGIVYWDSNENGTNGDIELTDDPYIDDGIDQDNDGETNDDDPTSFLVFAFEPPSEVIEDFSDDSPGGNATQYYCTRLWFETDSERTGNSFQVVGGYHYRSNNAFKTQIRASGGPQYWNYYISNLEGSLKWWEIMFACGNTSEDSDLYLYFKDGNGNDVARLKFEYVQSGSDLPTDWVLKLYYWSPIYGWERLNTNYPGWYLYNGWYRLRIEKDGNYLNYSLYKGKDELLDFKRDSQLSSSFSNLKQIEWRSTKDPVMCQMFFWDEHRIGLYH